MAEISTLTPSTPVLADPPASPSVPPPSTAPHKPSSPAKPTPTTPKSYLFHDHKPLTPPSDTPPSARLSPPPVLLTEQEPLPVPDVPTPAAAEAVNAGVPVSVAPAVGVDPLVPLIKQDGGDPAPLDSVGVAPSSAVSHQSEPSDVQAGQQQQTASPTSPGLNATPNLYPSVQVAAPNPTAAAVVVVNDEAQAPPKQAPVPAPAEPPASPPPGSTPTPGGPGTTAAQMKSPQSPPPPVPPKPSAGPRSPQHHAPPTITTGGGGGGDIAGMAESPPATPSFIDELPSTTALPVIQEPDSFYLPPSTPYKARPAPDTLSYLESASMMSGTLESLSGLGEDGSSVGSDSEVNGVTARRTDKYGFLGGNQYSEGGEKDLQVEVARQREMKWLDMFANWDKWIKQRFQKVKIRCRKGIPSSLRSKAWQLLSNSQDLLDANPGKFDELERQPGEAKWLDIIEKDLHRQFPFHEMFAARGGHGQQDLYRILKAYTVYRPEEGYCQAQAPVAAVLLMHMPAEQAFWCLVQICERYLPGYYSAGLEAIQLDGEIFFSLLRRTCPMAYRHLKKFKIDPILYMTEWFMCVFSRTLPWSCVLRVWDMFFCEGVKIVFRVGLVLLKQMLGSVDKLREVQGMYETMERLRNIAPELLQEDALVQEIVALPVTEALIERECVVQVRKWRESRGELTHDPGRRLNGTRAIHEQKRRASAIRSGGSFSFLGGGAPPPGPLRASSSLLSLTGFRRSRMPLFTSQSKKKGSFSGPSVVDARPPVSSAGRGPAHKPPLPGAATKGAVVVAPAAPPHVQSPLAGTTATATATATTATATTQPPQPPPKPGADSPSSSATTQPHPAGSAPEQSPSPPQQQQQQQPALLPPTTLMPAPPMVVSERVTPSIPSPMAHNAPLMVGGGGGGGGGGGPALPEPAPAESVAVSTTPPPTPPVTAAVAEETGDGGKKKRRSKEDKRKEKEEEKQKLKEREKKEKEERKKDKEERKKEERKKDKEERKKEKPGKRKENKGPAATAAVEASDERNGGGGEGEGGEAPLKDSA